MSYQSDLKQTINNKEQLCKNRNLLYWYKKLFSCQFEKRDISTLKVLEVGSGTSPLKIFYPNVITSDILELDYLDLVFDCHKINELKSIQNDSLDIIVMTNVLHHLRKPVLFLKKARTKLRKGGLVIITEPYFSWLSSPVYRFLHHEAVDSSIKVPELNDVKDSPLSSANVVLPYLLFYMKKEWLSPLTRFFRVESLGYFSCLSYFITGGISRRFLVPHTLFKLLFKFDMFVAKCFPKLTASFFTIKLIKKSGVCT